MKSNNYIKFLVCLCTAALTLGTAFKAEARGRGCRQHAGEEASATQASGGETSGQNGTQTTASVRDRGVNARQRIQRARIGNGLKNGTLTPQEAKSIAGQEQTTRQAEQQAKSDGTLTKDERKDLQKDLNGTSKEIYQDKHNDTTQSGGGSSGSQTGGAADSQGGASSSPQASTQSTPGIHDPGVNERQRLQRDRIAQGLKSGSLTKDEAKSLASDEKTIRQEERQDKSDGTLTKDERKDLHQDLDSASKDIYQEKHDDETR